MEIYTQSRVYDLNTTTSIYVTNWLEAVITLARFWSGNHTNNINITNFIVNLMYAYFIYKHFEDW